MDGRTGQFLKARPGDSPYAVEKLNLLIDDIREIQANDGDDTPAIEYFMKEMRRMMRRGLLAGSKEIIEEYGDPFFEQDELE